MQAMLNPVARDFHCCWRAVPRYNCCSLMCASGREGERHLGDQSITVQCDVVSQPYSMPRAMERLKLCFVGGIVSVRCDRRIMRQTRARLYDTCDWHHRVCRAQHVPLAEREGTCTRERR